MQRYIDKANEIINSQKLSHLNLAKVADNKDGWDKAIVVNDYNKHIALENNPYFNLFYTEKPTEEDFDGLDSLYNGLDQIDSL